MQKTRGGRAGEEYARSLLVENGYKIITSNFRSKFGEIDIVALDEDTLVFVEVKTRWSKKYGLPEEAVTPSKIKKIVKTGEYFQLLYPNYPGKLRIDVVAVEIENGRVASSRIIKNASG